MHANVWYNRLRTDSGVKCHCGHCGDCVYHYPVSEKASCSLLASYAPSSLRPRLVRMARKEWWLRDDYGNMIPFGGGGRPQIDPSVPAAQDFFANLSVSLFHVPGEAKKILDGVMVRSHFASKLHRSCVVIMQLAFVL